MATKPPPTKGEPASNLSSGDRSEEQFLLGFAQTLKLPAYLDFSSLIQDKIESFRLEKVTGTVIRANQL
ncbi:MAG: hypothetical protein HC899_39200 [Leptolyngbyaceae cyanobacterium SM1_4_3]|nr:hypothetical protein [Leptolyngbyaceae cyanobacterium SM1_4_3]